MAIVQQILFIILLLAAGFIFYKKAKSIYRNIKLGKPENLNDQPNVRFKNMMILAFGQKKMFKRITPALLHFLVYAGFVIINIEMLEIVLDGILGSHRLFAPYLGNAYGLLLNFFEYLALLVLVSCAVFLIRRNVLHIKRLRQGELKGWPKSDANYILITEIVLMSLLLLMNAADYNLQLLNSDHYPQVGAFAVSQYLAPIFEGWSEGSLIMFERFCWWLHIIGILAFLNYLPYSKHLHILLAFPNAFYARLTAPGEVKNMPDIQNEVLYMMEPDKAPTNIPADTEPPRFGAKDVQDLSWKSLLDAYSCTECGRCTSMCPANHTGKVLSPRLIMMKTRDRVEEVGKNIDTNKGNFVDDGKSLLHDYITTEELRACTSCNACVEACPVMINPLDIILELKRNLIMEESNAPQEWNMMFTNIENNMAPWKFSPDDRDNWVADLN